MAGSNSILTNPAERERLKAHDGTMLLVREIRDGNDTVIRTEWFLNNDREFSRFVEVAEGLDEVVNGDPDEIFAKGVSAEQIADAIYGSRHSYYTARVRSNFHYDGPVSMALSNGAILDQVDSLIVRTRVTDHFLSALNRTTAKCVDLTLRGIRRNAGRFNDTVSMLVRRNPDPAVAELADASRAHAHAELSRQAPAEIKALAPAPGSGKSGNGKPSKP